MSKILGYYTLNSHGKPLDVVVSVSRRTKNINIKIKEKVHLIVPEYTDMNIAYGFLMSKEILIRKKFFTGVIDHCDASDGLPEFIEILGRKMKIKLKHSHKNEIHISADTIIIESDKSYKKELKNFLKQLLFNEIKAVIQNIALEKGFVHSEIFVKELRSIWGSCSSTGNLSFNWRLVFAPIEVLNYVIIHELCHLKEMNHSRKFWVMVAKHCPKYKEHIKWLKLNGKMLGSHRIFQ